MKLPKTYGPSQYESNIYDLWEKSGAFRPRTSGTPYSIVIPPPNSNASLHIGFALTMSLEDIAIRYHRLKGDRTLFVPGADHAGFETQSSTRNAWRQKGRVALILAGKSFINRYAILWPRTAKASRTSSAGWAAVSTGVVLALR